MAICWIAVGIIWTICGIVTMDLIQIEVGMVAAGLGFHILNHPNKGGRP